ncbi:MAG: HEPN domain-containing protein [Candidatus Freyarchaeota archaeon]
MIAVTPENLQKAWQYAEISETDLNAAEALFEKELYPSAVFHMQQSIEKMVKSFLFSLGIKRTDEEVKKFHHRILDIYKEILQLCAYASPAIKIIREWLPVDEEAFLSQIDESRSKLDQLTTERGRKKLIAIAENEKELKTMLKKFDKTYSKVAQHLERPIKFSISKIKPSLPELIQFREFIQLLPPEERDRTFNHVIRNVRFGTLCFPYLVGFAVIFYPHAVSTRYPDDGVHPADFYVSELPLVKMFPEFIQRMRNGVVKNFHKFHRGYQELLDPSKRWW